MATNEATAATVRDGQNVLAVHERLRHEIIDGKIPSGVISQAALARQLDAGRTPLREAIRMLQREGLVISEPNRRLRIAEFSAADVEELYIMRIALEAAAIRLTVPTLDSSNIAELEGLMAQMEYFIRAEDYVGFRAPHQAFHACLVAGAGDRVATEMAQLFDHAERYRVNFCPTTPEVLNLRRTEHRQLIDTVVVGDPEVAVRELAAHYGRTAALVLQGLGTDYDAARLRKTLEAIAPGAEESLVLGSLASSTS
jgi:DNA-binding GntR family transcriptional regulator